MDKKAKRSQANTLKLTVLDKVRLKSVVGGEKQPSNDEVITEKLGTDGYVGRQPRASPRQR
jgi:hypothetical protein